MRVLLVNAFAAASASGRTRYDAFRTHVRRVLTEIERHDVTQVDLIEKPRHDLGTFLFEMYSEFADPQSITNFDRLDFVLVVGDASACPWSPQMRQLVLLTKLCMMTGKCFYGSGVGAALLAFLCATAGETLRVLTHGGKKSLLMDVACVVPPPPRKDTTNMRPRHSASTATEVLLDTRTGDLFALDVGRRNAWVPHGNTGLVLHTSDHAHDYGVRLNTARAGTKKTHTLSHTLVPTKRGDTKCCVRLHATHHELFRLGSMPPEFMVPCTSTWDLDERICATGSNQYTVLIDSARGPMLVEFGNCVGTHFTLAYEYPESCALLYNFMVAKVASLQVHEHMDRNLVSAISGSARLKQRLQLAATKTAVGVGGSSHPPRHVHTGLATGAVTMTSGRMSPKRCRPVSAGPYRSPAKAERTIQTSRSTTADPFVSEHERLLRSNQYEVRSAARPVRPHTAARGASMARRASKSPRDSQPETESPLLLDERPEAFVSPPIHDNATTPSIIKAHRRIRVAQRNELDKPYCALNKPTSKAEKVQQHQPKEPYYSVVNDAPYQSKPDAELLQYQQNKLQWVAGPFRSTVGKATTQLRTPDPGIFTNVPFDDRNAPTRILQRSSPARPPVVGKDPTTRPRPASASATSTRRPQRQRESN